MNGILQTADHSISGSSHELHCFLPHLSLSSPNAAPCLIFFEGKGAPAAVHVHTRASYGGIGVNLLKHPKS